MEWQNWLGLRVNKEVAMLEAIMSTVASLGLSGLIGLAVNRWSRKFEREPQWTPPFSE